MGVLPKVANHHLWEPLGHSNVAATLSPAYRITVVRETIWHFRRGVPKHWVKLYNGLGFEERPATPE